MSIHYSLQKFSTKCPLRYARMNTVLEWQLWQKKKVKSLVESGKREELIELCAHNNFNSMHTETVERYRVNNGMEKPDVDLAVDDAARFGFLRIAIHLWLHLTDLGRQHIEAVRRKEQRY